MVGETSCYSHAAPVRDATSTFAIQPYRSWCIAKGR